MSAVCCNPARTPAAGAWARAAGWLVLVGAIALAYANTLRVPFLLDDQPTIVENASIRNLAALDTVLAGGSVFTTGRPVLNLSFAINHALGGLSLPGLHVTNILIHVAAAGFLWAVATATLRRARFEARTGVPSHWAALSIALIWALHPLQVNSVTYLSQRAESLMGLCYLATLYCFIRGAEARDRAGRWQTAAVVVCALGMGVKEVMVTAPVVCFAYDAVFLAGSAREAWRQRWRVYLGLAASWLVLAALMLDSKLGARVLGTGVALPAESYGITHLRALGHYVGLALWPHPLIFDYGTNQPAFEALSLAKNGAVLVIAVTLSVYAWSRSRAVGFLCLCFFIWVAPTTTVLPVAGQRIAENRLYLPVISVAALLVVGTLSVLSRHGIGILVCASLALGVVTVHRNHDFRSAEAIWTDTVQKLPGNHRAVGWLGLSVLNDPSRYAEAVQLLRRANRSGAWDVDSYFNLGLGLLREPGKALEAASCFERAVRAKPHDGVAHAMLGTAYLLAGGRAESASAHFTKAVQLQPERGDFHKGLGTALLGIPERRGEAVRHLEAAIERNPADFEARMNLGNAFLEVPDGLSRAIVAYRGAIAVNPNAYGPWFNLGTALMRSGRVSEAADCFERALALNPGFAAARTKLEEARRAAGVMEPSSR